jgi:hypothetical protein
MQSGNKPPLFSEATASALGSNRPRKVSLDASLTTSTITLPRGCRIHQRTFTAVGDIAQGAHVVELARRDAASRRNTVALDGLLWTVCVSKRVASLHIFAMTGQDSDYSQIEELTSLQYAGLEGMSYIW